MIYFSSDLHLNHKNAIRFTQRPFSSLDQMNRQLIENFNSIVKPKDTLYLLGDVCLFREKEKYEIESLINRLNGNKILVYGNHDDPETFECYSDVAAYKEIKYHRRKLVLFHYPIVNNEWNGGYGHGKEMGKKNRKNASIMLHGHIHSKGPHYNRENRRKDIFKYDVGVDANDYKPVSINEIFNFFHLSID